MKKYKSYFFLTFLVIGFLALGYFVLGLKSKSVEIIEINFISDHAIAENAGDLIPSEIISFSSSYIENDTVDFLARISFKRSDIGNYNADSLNNFRFRIDKSLKISDANEMFIEENKSKKVTEKMYLNSEGSSSSIESDISNIRYFYLVPMNDSRVTGSTKYFDQSQKLKDYINEGLRQGNLFNDKKKNTITIILQDVKVETLLSGPNPPIIEIPKGDDKTENNTDSDNDNVIDTKDKCPDLAGALTNSGCPIIIDSKLKKPYTGGDKANLLTWNPDLKNKNIYKLTLKLTLQSTNSTYFEEDVSGLSSLIVPDEEITGYNNKYTIVTLEVEPLIDYIQIADKSKIMNAKFFCKTPE